MPKTKQQKREIVNGLRDRLQRANGVIVTEYQGLNVGELNDLRNKLRKVSSEYHIIQNTLLQVVSKDTEYAVLDSTLKGPTALCFVYGDPAGSAKVMVDFKKGHEKFKIKAGFIEKKIVDEKQLKSLASLPPRQILLGLLVGRLQAPIGNFVYVLNAPLQKLVGVLDEIKKKRAP